MRRSRVFRMAGDPGPQETGRKEAIVYHYTDSKRVQVDPAKFQTHKIKTKEERGREAWEYIHTAQDEPQKALDRFESMIPCGECKASYRNFKEQFPPDTTDPDSFFRWGWFLHNLVNEKLGKPLIELEEARRIWNRPEPTE